MRIGIAARGLSEKSGGVKEYIFNIIKALLSIDKKNQYFLFYNKKNFLGKFPQASEIVLDTNNKLIWDYIKLSQAIKKNKIDVCIFPKNIVPFNVKCKSVIIIHDLLHILDPSVYKWYDSLYMKLFIPLSVKKADIIVTVSQNTKKDLIKLLKVNKNKVYVVYEGVDKKFRLIKNEEENKKRIIEKYKLKLPYILYVGSLSPRKNLPRLIKAFEKAKSEKNIPHSLVLAGGKMWKEKKIYDIIKQSPYAKDILLTGFIADEELPYLYNLADLSAYPSLYEGFGLPILEAQACGCPVLTSKISSIPEVTGSSAYLTNPYAIDSISQAIIEIIENPALKKELIHLGFKNIQRFSWQKTAKELIELITNAKTNL